MLNIRLILNIIKYIGQNIKQIAPIQSCGNSVKYAPSLSFLISLRNTDILKSDSQNITRILPNVIHIINIKQINKNIIFIIYLIFFLTHH